MEMAVIVSSTVLQLLVNFRFRRLFPTVLTVIMNTTISSTSKWLENNTGQRET